MGCDTNGKIKGYVSAEEILNFIRQKYDPNAKSYVTRDRTYPINEVTWKYKFNEHSKDNDYWYTEDGYITFTYKDEQRQLFYVYSNINSFENEDYYENLGLLDMVKAETTSLSLGCWGSSVEIITELVAQFGGGWVDNNDCDSEEYYPVELNVDDSIKPVIVITRQELYDKFGGIVIIKED